MKVQNHIFLILALLVFFSCAPDSRHNKNTLLESEGKFQIDSIIALFNQEFQYKSSHNLSNQTDFIDTFLNFRKAAFTQLKLNISETDLNVIMFEGYNIFHKIYSAQIFFYNLHECYGFNYRSYYNENKFGSIKDHKIWPIIHSYGNNITLIPEQKQFTLGNIDNIEITNLYIFSKFKDYPEETTCKIIYNPSSLENKLSEILEGELTDENRDMYLLDQFLLNFKIVDTFTSKVIKS